MASNNLELFYDVLSSSNDILWEATHKTYPELTVMTMKNIASSQVKQDVEDDVKKQLTEVYDKLSDVDFSVEDVRRAVSSIVIKGFRETDKSYSKVTPDVICFLFAYFISRLLGDKKSDIKILDPMSNSGNLLFTVANHLDLDLHLYAVDNSQINTEIISSLANLLEQNISVYFQETMSTYMSQMNFIVSDLEVAENNEKFFPYELLKHYIPSLAKDGYIILLVQEDFFNYGFSEKFSSELASNLSVVGCFSLPENLFAGVKKNIVIFKNSQIKSSKSLMANIPDLNDPKELNEFFGMVESWFEKNI